MMNLYYFNLKETLKRDTNYFFYGCLYKNLLIIENNYTCPNPNNFNMFKVASKNIKMLFEFKKCETSETRSLKPQKQIWNLNDQTSISEHSGD